MVRLCSRGSPGLRASWAPLGFLSVSSVHFLGDFTVLARCCGNSEGMSDDNWWLNLYVMFSRVTRMSDMLLLRPPPRKLLERSPPANIQEQPDIFAQGIENSTVHAEELARQLSFELSAVSPYITQCMQQQRLDLRRALDAKFVTLYKPAKKTLSSV